MNRFQTVLLGTVFFSLAVAFAEQRPTRLPLRPHPNPRPEVPSETVAPVMVIPKNTDPVLLEPGDKLVLNLPFQGGTPFRWGIESLEARHFSVTSDPTKPIPVPVESVEVGAEAEGQISPPIAGGVERMKYVLTATGLGEGTITFALRKSFGDRAAIGYKTIRYRIVDRSEERNH